ncbi:hypothetical protein, partial [Vibrio parahaemolyticus]
FLCGQNEAIKNKLIDLIIAEKQLFAEKNPDIGIKKEKVTQYTPLPFDLKKIWGKLSFDDKVTWREKEQQTPEYEDGGEGDFSKLISPTFKPPGNGPNPPFKGGNNIFSKPLELMRTRLLDSQYDFFLSPAEWSIS